MRRSKSVVIGLSIGACLASAVSAAHAGGGMGAGDLKAVTAPMACRLILNATNEPQAISIVDGLTGGDAVKVGAAVLYCQTAIATRLSGPATLALSGDPDSITCYNLAGADQAKNAVSFTDPFGEQDVTTGGISVFCVPAITSTIGP